MAVSRYFDFVLRKEQRRDKNPPYVLRSHVVLGNPSSTSGFSKSYVAIGNEVRDYEEAEALIKSMERELYGLRKKARAAFDAVAKEQKRVDDAAAEAAAYEAKKAAEKAAEAEEEEAAAKRAEERRRRED